MKQIALTTIDNPYDPIEQWDDWYPYDVNVLNHNTCSYMARIQERFGLTYEETIDNIIRFDPFNLYKKIVKEIKSENENVDEEEFVDE